MCCSSRISEKNLNYDSKIYHHTQKAKNKQTKKKSMINGTKNKQKKGNIILIFKCIIMPASIT